MTKLEDLVPPLEECKAAYEAGVIGDTTAMVWRNRTGEMSSDCRVKMREPEDISYQYYGGSVKFYPAPTLEELLEMINKTSGTHPTVEAHEHDTWRVRAFTPGMLMWERDKNAAAAALRLLVRVKQGDVSK